MWKMCSSMIVRAVAQRHLRQLHAHPHPIRSDVIEVVEVDAAHRDGAQRVEARGRCVFTGMSLFPADMTTARDHVLRRGKLVLRNAAAHGNT